MVEFFFGMNLESLGSLDPKELVFFHDKKIVKIFAGDVTSFFIDDRDQLYSFGINYPTFRGSPQFRGIPGSPFAVSDLTALKNKRIVQVDVENCHALILTDLLFGVFLRDG